MARRTRTGGIAAAFLSTQPDARELPFELSADHAMGVGWQILPGEGGLDGMYYAVIKKPL